ncbi:uncharacterized protein LOC144432789 [Glandiceps talaboti]
MFKEVVLLSIALAVVSLKDSPINERQAVGCEFRCFTGECVPQAEVCDDNNNCPNGEDEHPIECFQSPVVSSYSYEYGNVGECVYNCINFAGEDTCIGTNDLCNVFPNCKDWSDELDPAHGCNEVFGDCRCSGCLGCSCTYYVESGLTYVICNCTNGYSGDGLLCNASPTTTVTATPQTTSHTVTTQPTSQTTTTQPTSQTPTTQPTSQTPTTQPTSQTPTTQPTSQTVTTQPTGQTTTVQPSTSQPASNKIHCEADEMFVAVPMEWMATEFQLGETDATGFHLNDPSCVGTMEDGVFVFRTMLYNCLTTSLELQDGNISYSNMVFSAGNRKLFEMTCLYPTEYHIAAPIHIVSNPCPSFVHFLGFGKYTIEATFYSNNSFTGTLDPATDFPIVICDDTFIYFGIAVKSNDYNLELLVQNCFISDSADPRLSSVSYDILTDACLSAGVAGYEQVSGNTLEKLFCVDISDILQGVKVTVADDIELYLHCSIMVCKIDDVGTPCDLGCVNGLKREFGEVTTGSTHSFITHGPFTSTQGERCTNT